MTPTELVQAACPKIGSLGAAFYFDSATVSRGKELGLDGFRFYVLGRGGVLGNVEPAVISSAFGYFTPDLVTKMWTSGSEVMAPREAARHYLACAQEFGRATFSGIEGLDAYCEAAGAINDAADGASLALYAGVAAEPLCDDTPGRAMQLTATLREYRGSAHLAAIRALSLDPAVAHVIKRPDEFTLFGYSEAPSVTAEDRAKHEQAEVMTDAMVLGAFSAVDSDGAAALMAGLEAMEAALAG
ncbi:MAG: hypothetical protein GY724_08665 [Actinomycetia bacterium]|nr:hypothetical protein [Actinomycetes bacterium]